VLARIKYAYIAIQIIVILKNFACEVFQIAGSLWQSIRWVFGEQILLKGVDAGKHWQS
jgi:hypothetical protein